MFSGGAYAAWMARASDDNVCGRTGPWGTGGERWPVLCAVYGREDKREGGDILKN